MSRTKEEYKVQPKFNEEGNSVIIEEGSNTGASNALALEDLMKQL
jgi:hypothetical protein